MSHPVAAAKSFDAFKVNQRKNWAGFAVNEGFTTVVAGEFVAFAKVRPGDTVLDVGCGTGVVAVTAARAGALVDGLDLTPVLLERARDNAAIAGVVIDFIEGDAEALPYADASFDVVLSQFGHMFAPRPDVVTAEMLRVLKPGGCIAFATWPPEHLMGQFFALVGRSSPTILAEGPTPAPPPLWGDPSIVRARLGDRVSGLRFGRSTMNVPVLSPAHYAANMEASLGPLTALLAQLDRGDPKTAAAIRAEIASLAAANMEGNMIRQHYLMSRAVKNP